MKMQVKLSPKYVEKKTLRKPNPFKSCAIEWRGAAVTATLPLSYLWLLLPARPAFPWVAAKLGAPVFVKASPILSVVETVHYLTTLRRAVARANLYLEARWPDRAPRAAACAPRPHFELSSPEKIAQWPGHHARTPRAGVAEADCQT